MTPTRTPISFGGEAMLCTNDFYPDGTPEGVAKAIHAALSSLCNSIEVRVVVTETAPARVEYKTSRYNTSVERRVVG